MKVAKVAYEAASNAVEVRGNKEGVMVSVNGVNVNEEDFKYINGKIILNEDVSSGVTVAVEFHYVLPADETPTASGTFTWSSAAVGTNNLAVSAIALDLAYSSNYQLTRTSFASQSFSGYTLQNGTSIETELNSALGTAVSRVLYQSAM